MPAEGKAVTVKFEGKDCTGVEVDVEESTERWSSVRLADGSRLRLKASVLTVVRLDDRFDNDDNPIYMVKSTNLLSVNSPDSIRKQPQGLDQKVQ